MRPIAALLATSFAALALAGQTKPAGADVERSTPLYQVDVVARTTQAVNYGFRSQPTRIDFEGTVLQPKTKGKAWIEAKKGAVDIRAKFKNLESAQRYGPQYLTYVLWAITPDGRAVNLGEILTDGGNDAKLDTATELQTFALIMTAEPYYAVTQPSDVVVMENIVRPDTAGSVQTVDAKYALLKRGRYTFDVEAAGRRDEKAGKKVSQAEYEALVELYQARNAVQLARIDGAGEFASETFARAESRLRQAERLYKAQPKSRSVVTLAREATQTAEDARLIAQRVAPEISDRERAASGAR